MFDTPEFRALRREYVESALERVAHLRAEAASLRAGTAIDLQELRQEVHKFRGSGGFYGFQALSNAAAATEDLILLVRDGEAELHPERLGALIDAVVQAAVDAAAEVGLPPQT